MIPLAIVLRYRDGSESERSVSLAPGGSDSAATNRFLLELLGPPVALLKSREAHASFSVEALQRRLTVLGGQTRLVELRDDGGVLPLGWTLSERARRAIDDQVAQLDLGFLEQAGLVKGGSGGPEGRRARLDGVRSDATLIRQARTRSAPGPSSPARSAPG